MHEEAADSPNWAQHVRESLDSSAVDPATERDLLEELTQHADDRYRELLESGVAAAVAFEIVHDEVARLADVERDAWPGSVSSGSCIVDEAAPSESIQTSNRVLGARHYSDEPETSRVREWNLFGIWHDARYAWRGLTRAPVFTIVAVVSLAFGIGATTAGISLLHTFLLERLALPRAEELVTIHPVDRSTTTEGARPVGTGIGSILSYTTYRAFRAANTSPAVEGFAMHPLTVLAGDRESALDYDVWTDLVTGGWFELLGARPFRGRTISLDDEVNGAPVAVISYQYWLARFSADSSIVGHRIDIAGRHLTVIGVMPASFRGLYFGRAFTVAVPITLAPQLTNTELRAEQVLLVTRVAGGMTRDSERARIEAALMAMGTPTSVELTDASRGLRWSSDLRGTYRAFSYALTGGVVILLLIACANVGTMLSSRAMSRERELAIRLSLGASSGRIARLLMIESLELALIGTLFGILIARTATTLIASRLPSNAMILADLIPLRVSPAMLGTVAATLLSVTLFIGVLPALLASRSNLRTPLSRRAQRILPRWRVDHALIAVQIALSLVLVSSAALFVQTLRALTERNGGYRTSRVLLTSVNVFGTRYESDPIAAYAASLSAVRRVPGVASSGLGSTAPLVGRERRFAALYLDGASAALNDRQRSDLVVASPGYLDAVGSDLIAGRDFTAADASGAPRVAILSEALARRLGDPRSLVGRVVAMSDTLRFSVIGVASNVHQPQMSKDTRADISAADPVECLYVPLSQSTPWLRDTRPILVVRTSVDPNEVGLQVRRVLNTTLPGLRLDRFQTVTQALDDALPRERLAATTSTAFSIVALLLSAVGVFGVVAFFVAQRTSEIGVRLALGARSSDAWFFVVRHMLIVTSVGIVLGAVSAITTARLIRSQLYGIEATNPWLLSAAATLLMIVALTAAGIPAFRAAKVDPMIVLRAE